MWNKRRSKKMVKNQSLFKGQKKARKVDYKAKLDKVFSLYIRLKYSDANGYCRCISCGKIHFYKDIQNGHYMSRRYMSTRFDENNCRPQCVACNIFNQGNIQMYRIGLVKQIGERAVNLVEVKARTSVVRYSDFEYKALIKYYTVLVEKFKKDKGL